MQNYILPERINAADIQRMSSLVQATLHGLRNQDVINDFVVEDVNFLRHDKPFQEVECLPITARPGDPLIVEDVYRGIIISTDGAGKGVIFTTPRNDKDEGEFYAKVKVRASVPLEYISIDVKVEV